MNGNEVIEDRKEGTIIENDASVPIGILTDKFISSFYPAYTYKLVSESIRSLDKEDSLSLLNKLSFYQITECTVPDKRNKSEFLKGQMKALFTMAYTLNQRIYYGLNSYEGKTSLLIGTDNKNEALKDMLNGLLPGIKVEPFSGFENKKDQKNGYDISRYVGCVSGIPSCTVNGTRDFSSIMRTLNGKNYTVMAVCRPVPPEQIRNKIKDAIDIQDRCFQLAKNTISMQRGRSDSKTHTKSNSKSITHSVTESTSVTQGVSAGRMVSGVLAGAYVSHSSGTSTTDGTTITKGYSDAVTHTINENEGISKELQNGFAIELMNMASSMADRLRMGWNIGLWEIMLSYSADDEYAERIIRGDMYSKVASEDKFTLPPLSYSYKSEVTDNYSHVQQLVIPKSFCTGEGAKEPIPSSLMTSEELCGICMLPVNKTVGFNIVEDKGYPLSYESINKCDPVGYVCDREHILENIPFGLNEEELNRHTFVCGITGSGKTNSVKMILSKAKVPFMVIEPAKKEYRNMKLNNGKKVNVYSWGRAELNCPKMNPFYLLPGISPQQHIDALKDLFSASFGFYGPMPYIMERCLYNIYEKKGWNLILGIHPKLHNIRRMDELFDEKHLMKAYKKDASKYLFPTMQDLKHEIDDYVEQMTNYGDEIKGNIRSALKARVDSLCVATKGYMFNTNECMSFQNVLENPTVFELEGLADDADKAFALGLLIIYINEYRQVENELDEKKILKHLLVIEEAHRLLKNIQTENITEIGNPKGKAVEHFTNMLSEMRSYGQGVIIAEQIPSKLAPDIIKNSSNKIVHRIVSRDDQELMASTIGVSADESIYLGNRKSGFALCHREGMVEPVAVKFQKAAEEKVSDSELYKGNSKERILHISESIISSQFESEIYKLSIRILVSLLYEEDCDSVADILENSICDECENIESMIKAKLISLVSGRSITDCIRSCIARSICEFMTVGAFSGEGLPKNECIEIIKNIITNGVTCERMTELQSRVREYYEIEPKLNVVRILVSVVLKTHTDSKTYFNEKSLLTVLKTYTLKENIYLAQEVYINLCGRV